ncbi:lipoprotein [Streptomyces viridiviolaceus]|nr:lipoprotein [Streptomyces viridiviolaceus]
MARVHRTTTTAALLVSVAVSALTGCVTVQRPSASDPAAAGARSSAPRPDGPTTPRAVQAPAREALEMIAPSRAPERPSGEPRRAAPPAAPSQRTAPAARPEPHPRPARPEPRRPQHDPARGPRAGAPGRSGPVDGRTGADADLCSLGKRYGGWRPDSPEAVICEQAYGG